MSSMVTHELKTLAPYFDAVERGDKTFEVRRDDRGFQKGDALKLYRIERVGEAGWKANRSVSRTISYVLTGGQFGVEPGYVVLGLAPEAAALSKREGADRKPCTCSDETIARVNAGDICGMGGCPYGGDL